MNILESLKNIPYNPKFNASALATALAIWLFSILESKLLIPAGIIVPDEVKYPLVGLLGAWVGQFTKNWYTKDTVTLPVEVPRAETDVMKAVEKVNIVKDEHK